jgi:hypothetical protein
MVIYGPDIFHDDPSPEDIQRAFAAEQAQHTADFQRALSGGVDPQLAGHLMSIYGTPNEPERELSAADVRDILQDLTATVQYLCDMAYIRAADKWDAARAQVYGAKVKQLAERLNDAPPY